MSRGCIKFLQKRHVPRVANVLPRKNVLTIKYDETHTQHLQGLFHNWWSWKQTQGLSCANIPKSAALVDSPFARQLGNERLWTSVRGCAARVQSSLQTTCTTGHHRRCATRVRSHRRWVPVSVTENETLIKNRYSRRWSARNRNESSSNAGVFRSRPQGIHQATNSRCQKFSHSLRCFGHFQALGKICASGWILGRIVRKKPRPVYQTLLHWPSCQPSLQNLSVYPQVVQVALHDAPQWPAR